MKIRSDKHSAFWLENSKADCRNCDQCTDRTICEQHSRQKRFPCSSCGFRVTDDVAKFTTPVICEDCKANGVYQCHATFEAAARAIAIGDELRTTADWGEVRRLADELAGLEIKVNA